MLKVATISPWEKGKVFHLNKFESPYLKVVLWQVWLKLAQWFRGRRFENVFYVLLLFCYYLPLEKEMYKIKSSSLKDALWQVWLKLAPWFFLKCLQCIFFSIISPLKGSGPSFAKKKPTWINFTQRCSAPSLVKIHWVILEKMKISLQRTTDNSQSEKLT